jgi:hypothetical protein
LLLCRLLAVPIALLAPVKTADIHSIQSKSTLKKVCAHKSTLDENFYIDTAGIPADATVGIPTGLRVKQKFKTAGIPTEHIAGIPTGLRVKMWNRGTRCEMLTWNCPWKQWQKLFAAIFGAGARPGSKRGLNKTKFGGGLNYSCVARAAYTSHVTSINQSIFRKSRMSTVLTPL